MIPLQRQAEPSGQRACAKVRRRERVAPGEVGERSLEVREVDPLSL